MTLRSSIALSLLLASTPVFSALAQTTDTPQVAKHGETFVFTTVDSYELVSSRNANISARITGILQGESTPRTIQFDSWSSLPDATTQMVLRCERMALLAASKPGRSRLSVTYMGGGFGAEYVRPGCKLEVIR